MVSEAKANRRKWTNDQLDAAWSILGECQQVRECENCEQMIAEIDEGWVHITKSWSGDRLIPEEEREMSCWEIYATPLPRLEENNGVA